MATKPLAVGRDVPAVGVLEPVHLEGLALGDREGVVGPAGRVVVDRIVDLVADDGEEREQPPTKSRNSTPKTIRMLRAVWLCLTGCTAYGCCGWA